MASSFVRAGVFFRGYSCKLFRVQDSVSLQRGIISDRGFSGAVLCPGQLCPSSKIRKAEENPAERTSDTLCRADSGHVYDSRPFPADRSTFYRHAGGSGQRPG